MFGISHDIIEILVARPPLGEVEAMELAEEQYLYCGDIVWQGVGSVEALARDLRDNSIWYFWWD